MKNARRAGPLLLLACSLHARTVELQIYPPTVRMDAASAGQTLLVDGGISTGAVRALARKPVS